MKEYFTKTTEEVGTVYWFDEGNRRIVFVESSGNRHWEEYLEWLADGNEPETI